MNFIRIEKNKKIIILTLIMTILLGSGVNSYADSVQTIENEYENTEAFVKGLMAAVNKTNVVQGHKEHYTTDSKNYEAEPEMKANSIVNAQVKVEGGELKIAGQEVSSFKITVATTEHLNSDNVAEIASNMFGYDKETYLRVLENGWPDGYTYGYFADMGNTSTITVSVGSDGYMSYIIPEDFPEGIFVFDSVIVGDTEVEINVFKRVYIRNGEIEEIIKDNPNGSSTSNTEPEANDSHRWSTLTTSTKSYEHLTPSVTGGISSTEYDVTKAIPTSENLTFSATADDSLYSITERKWVGQAGVKNITLKATAKYKTACTCTKKVKYIDENGKERTKSVRTYEHEYHTVTVQKTEEKYTYTSPEKIYYDVPVSNIYPVTNAVISGAPMDGSVTIPLTGGPTKSADTINVIRKKPDVNDTETYDCGLFETKAAAQASLAGGIDNIKNRIKVKVDSCITLVGSCNYSYRGLYVTSTNSNGTKPSVQKTSNSVTKMIPSTKLNGNYTPTGTTSYVGMLKFGFGVNNVFVHTPVVNNASITYVEPFVNQKINVDSSRTYLQLDKSFKITIPNYGTHIDEKGYKTRTYNSMQAVTKYITNWGKIKDVKFTFDVYLHDGNNRVLIKAGHWLSEYGKATSNGEYTFTIPIWAQEGNGEIVTRVIAENGSGDASSQMGANLNYNNYIATKNIQVEIIGKIYDLRISSTNDPGWQNIKGKNGNYITASEFAFGQAGQNGVTGYKYAPKLGYTIAFDFKTKGIKSNSVNVSIQPEGFYFVSKNGGNAERVDLYYSTTTKKYIKINTDDTTNIPIVTNLTSSFMKVNKQELVDSTRIMKNKLGVSYVYSSNVNIGYFPRLYMPENLRLCYNNFAEYIGNGLYKKSETEIAKDAVNGLAYNSRWGALSDTSNGKDVVIGSVGHWYAGYKLPASTVAVPVGKTSKDIVNNPSLIKKDGYILVKFNIRTNYNEYEYLEYKGPESLAEGVIEKDDNGTTLNWPSKGTTSTTPSHTIDLPNGKTANVPIGIVAIFETDYKSSNDYETEGTH